MQQAGVSDYNLVLLDEASVSEISALVFYYDIETHRISPVRIQREGEEADIAGGACSVARTELGKQNPRTTVIELAISCADVDVPGLGPVPIDGTVVVDELAWPEF